LRDIRSIVMPGPRLRRLRVSAADLIQPLAAVFARGLEAGIKFGFQIVLARTLGSTEAGLFLLALSIQTVLHNVAHFGIDHALIPSVARLNAREPKETTFAAILAALGLLFLASIPFALAVALVAGPVSSGVFGKPELAGPLRWLALGIIPYALLSGIGSALTGLGAAAAGDFLKNSLWQAACTILLLGLATAAGAAAAATATTVVAMLCSWMLLRRLLPARWPPLRRLTLPAGLTATAAPLYVVDTIGIVLVSVPTVLLGAFGSSEEVAIFAVANRIALIILAVTSAIGYAASPRFTVISDDNDKEALGRALSRVALLATAICLPLALGVLIFPREIMALFGPDYVAGAPVLRVLIAGNLLCVGFTGYSELLAMSGNAHLLRTVSLVVLAVCTVLSLGLIPLFGAMGAAAASAITVSVGAILSGLAVRRRLGLPAIPLLAVGVADRFRRPVPGR